MIEALDLIGLLVPYAILIFFESFDKTRTQHKDMKSIPIELSEVEKVNDILIHTIKVGEKEYHLKKIILAVHRANGLLRIVGFVPVFLYLIGFIFKLLPKELFTDSTIFENVGGFLYIGAFAISIFYFFYRVNLKIPEYLSALHPDYKDKGVLKIYLNIFPLWR